MKMWTTVKEKVPETFGNVLVSLYDRLLKKEYVIPCYWDYFSDAETGEILGPPSFVGISEENGKTIFVDYQQDKRFEIEAWQHFPEPYKDSFKVIVAGSRTFSDYGLLKSKLDVVFKKRRPSAIICGEAKGADTLGRKYAEENNITVASFPANWKEFGKQAGYLRNEEMADNADACIVFWDGKSAGTKHMIETAKKKGLQLRIVKFQSKKNA